MKQSHYIQLHLDIYTSVHGSTSQERINATGGTRSLSPLLTNQQTRTIRWSSPLRGLVTSLICIDSRALNIALRCKRYQLLTIEDALLKLTNSKHFINVYFIFIYWNVVWVEKSSCLTSFQTGFTWCRWLRFPFEICASSEIFQKCLHLVLNGLNRVTWSCR